MEIDQFYPQKEMGKDSDGHTIIEGGSGCKSTYGYRNGQWTTRGGIFYD